LKISKIELGGHLGQQVSGDPSVLPYSMGVGVTK